MSRSLRNGRAYDTKKEYVPKPRKRKNTGATGDDNGEQAVVKMSKGLTFGSLPPGEHVTDPTLVVLGAGKRRGVTFDGSASVKISPALYRSIHGRLPPIRQPLRLEPARDSDARDDTDVPNTSSHTEILIENFNNNLHGEVVDSSDGAASSALRAETDSSPATVQSAPAASNAPTTPSEHTTISVIAESSSDEDQVYSTAQTSRVREENSTARSTRVWEENSTAREDRVREGSRLNVRGVRDAVSPRPEERR